MLPFPFRELHSVSSWDHEREHHCWEASKPRVQCIHPRMMWEAVVHCQGIKLHSLMSYELLVRSSSPSYLNFQGAHSV